MKPVDIACILALHPATRQPLMNWSEIVKPDISHYYESFNRLYNDIQRGYILI